MKAITGFVFSHVALLLHILTSTQCSSSAETLMTAVSMSGVAFCHKLHSLLTISSIPFFFFLWEGGWRGQLPLKFDFLTFSCRVWKDFGTLLVTVFSYSKIKKIISVLSPNPLLFYIAHSELKFTWYQPLYTMWGRASFY